MSYNVPLGYDGEPLAKRPRLPREPMDSRERALQAAGTAFLRAHAAGDYEALADAVESAHCAPAEYGYRVQYTGRGPVLRPLDDSQQAAVDADLDRASEAFLVDPADRAETLEWFDRRRLPAELQNRPIRSTRPRQLPVFSPRPLTPGGTPNRFGCVQHADGYVFGTQVEGRMRVRDGKRKRVLMVVA